ncbi:MAG: MurR/RpiR family transcriptional regulator [Firmicutes bacterium]|nr:MurR/RpiR family transcriptional regulator [Bacillota bacterium]
MEELNEKIRKEIKDNNIKINSLFVLKKELNNLRVSEQKVVNYILKKPFEIFDMTINELAAKANSSEATVVRTCKNLNLKGFQELKYNLKHDIEEALSRFYDEILPDDTAQELVSKVFKANAQTIDDTLKMLNIEDFIIALKKLKKANKIAIFGQGGAAPVALDAYHMFINLGVDCLWQADANMQIIHAKSLNKDDVCIAISRSGEMKDVINSVKVAQKEGAFCIAITASPGSFLSEIADVILYAKSANTVFRNIDTAERIAELTILDALYIGFANNDIIKTREALRASAKATSIQRVTK